MNIPNVFAAGSEPVKNSFFSIEVPNNWTYTENSDTSQARSTGYGPINTVISAPSNFSELLLTDSAEEYKKLMHNGGAVAIFSHDTDFPLKNAPLESYVKYKINQGITNVTSQQYTTVGKEKAIVIESPRPGYNRTWYFIMHDNHPYHMVYLADTAYDKYLPEFEKMLRSFRFMDNPLSEIGNSEKKNLTSAATNFSVANLTGYNTSDTNDVSKSPDASNAHVTNKGICTTGKWHDDKFVNDVYKDISKNPEAQTADFIFQQMVKDVFDHIGKRDADIICKDAVKNGRFED